MTIFLSGCGVYDLGNFTVPDDMEFIACIEQLDTPEKICQYMADNIIYESHFLYTPDPYTIWRDKRGDCNDMSAFAVFVANYNGIEAYQVAVMIASTCGHAFAVYREGGKYSFSSNYTYYKPEYDSFRGIVEYFFDEENTDWVNYSVYDHNNNLVESGVR